MYKELRSKVKEILANDPKFKSSISPLPKYWSKGGVFNFTNLSAASLGEILCKYEDYKKSKRIAEGIVDKVEGELLPPPSKSEYRVVSEEYMKKNPNTSPIGKFNPKKSLGKGIEALIRPGATNCREIKDQDGKTFLVAPKNEIVNQQPPNPDEPAAVLGLDDFPEGMRKCFSSVTPSVEEFEKVKADAAVLKEYLEKAVKEINILTKEKENLQNELESCTKKKDYYRDVVEMSETPFEQLIPKSDFKRGMKIFIEGLIMMYHAIDDDVLKKNSLK